jgi:hypothetical protein
MAYVGFRGTTNCDRTASMGAKRTGRKPSGGTRVGPSAVVREAGVTPFGQILRPTPTAFYCNLSKKMAEVFDGLSKINGQTFKRA